MYREATLIASIEIEICEVVALELIALVEGE